MKLFLDTEFNGFGGELISLALAAEDGREWYEVAKVPSHPHPWVKEHVLPYLAIDGHRGNPIELSDFQDSFAAFIKQYPNCEVIADWPSDLEHFCRMMTYAGRAGGWRIPVNCTMRLINSGDTKPEIPHNALSDARALRDWYLGLQGP